MKTIGISIMKNEKTLHYPYELVEKSFGPLDDMILYYPLYTFAPDGNKVFRELLTNAIAAALRKEATHILYLEADEMMRPEHVEELVKEAPAVAYLPRLQLWRNPHDIRLDWTFTLPRWCAVEALTDLKDGDGGSLPIKREYALAQFPQWPIYHLSRIGHPRMIANRRRAVANIYANEGPIVVPDVYDFVPRRYECWVPGKMPPPVEPILVHNEDVPEGIVKWETQDFNLGQGRP